MEWILLIIGVLVAVIIVFIYKLNKHGEQIRKLKHDFEQQIDAFSKANQTLIVGYRAAYWKLHSKNRK